MTEDEISEEMYLACHQDDQITVLTWQGVGGKSYFYRDLRFLLPCGRKQKPDLVVLHDDSLWIIEIKGSHEESHAEDEPKLEELRQALTSAEIRQQASRCARVVLQAHLAVRFAVAYSEGHALADCIAGIDHLPWVPWRPDARALFTNA
jgi:hypothetical protein